MSRINFENYDEMDVVYDSDHQILWCNMNPKPNPCFTPGLLKSIENHYRALPRLFQDYHSLHGAYPPIRYQILASNIPGIFNYGGDLSLFARLIRAKDREKLYQYARLCIDCAYLTSTNFNLPILTISLVCGDAFAGGMEAALASNILIAEKGTRFGVPEILFGLFPGMGAYSFLARRLNISQAEHIILDGKIYLAEELHQMGIVDVLAEKGKGIDTLHRFTKNVDRKFATYQAMHKIRQRYNPVTYEELDDITKIWVDTALSLNEHDLRKMERLASAQFHKLNRVTK